MISYRGLPVSKRHKLPPSMAEISRETGISKGQLSRFVHGERSLSLPAADRLVKYFRLKLVKQ